jgi:hypothetical protein
MKPRFIIIHHSATTDGPGLSWPAIRRYHLEFRKWKDIGYHAGVDLVEDNYEILLGRPANVKGAHCPGKNSDSLGLVFTGNFNEHAPTAGMLETAATRILVPWMLAYDIPPEGLQPHRAYRTTDCPGRLFPMEQLVNIVKLKLQEI